MNVARRGPLGRLGLADPAGSPSWPVPVPGRGRFGARFALLLLFFLATPGLPGCQGGDGDGDGDGGRGGTASGSGGGTAESAVVRLAGSLFPLDAIEADETVVLGPSDTVAVRTFGFGASAEGWRGSAHVLDLGVRDESLTFRSGGIDPFLWVDGLELDASRVSRLVIELAVDRFTGMPSVYWATSDAPEFSESRRVYFTISRETGVSTSARQTVVVPLAGHPEWRGTVTSLRIDPTDVAGAAVAIEEVRLEDAPEVRPRRSYEALGPEWRRVRIAPAGDDWTVEIDLSAVDLGDAPSLDVGLAPLPYSFGQRGALRFRVIRPSDDGNSRGRAEEGKDAAGAKERTLLDETVRVSSGDPDFVDRRVPLKDVASGEPGDRIRLRFRVDAADDASRAAAAAGKLAGMWTAPAILADRAESERTNVLVISLDTLRADRLGCYGYGKPTSPRIDRLAAEGTLFERAIAQAPETLASHMSIMTGRIPTAHAVTGDRDDLARAYDTLAAGLLGSGHVTAAFTEGGYVSGRFGFCRGFQRYHDGTEPTPERPGGDVERTFARAREWIERYGHRPFFLFVHTYEVHVPYAPPERYRTFGPSDYDGDWREVSAIDHREHVIPINAGVLAADARDREWIEGLYDGEVAFTDHEVGRLLDTLEAQGLLDRTIVIVLSDHGEEFGEHGGFALHGHTLYDEIVRVPLILRGPGVPAGRRIDRPVGLYDLLPTLAERFGFPLAEDVDGSSLVPWLASETSSGAGTSAADVAGGAIVGERADDRVIVSEDGTVYPRLSLRTDEAVYVRTRGVEKWWVDEILRYGQSPLVDLFLDVTEEELYHRGEDPRLQNDLASRRPDELERWRDRGAKLLEQARATAERRGADRAESSRGGIDARRLEALGYVQGTSEALPVSDVRDRVEAFRRGQRVAPPRDEGGER